MKRLSSALAALAVATGLVSPAFAETTLNVHYPMPGFFKDVMADISKKFMEENPDIKINFVSPSATYEEGIQTIMRQAGTSELPDITFTGLNRLRVLAERNIGVDMKPLVDKEADLEAQGFTDHLLSLARVGDRQVGLAFATSNPIMYYIWLRLRAATQIHRQPPGTR